MQLPDINLVRYFLVTARTLNYSAASRELYISRQALTKNIRHMEDMLGGPLFVQESGHLSLTQMGTELQQAALPMMASWHTFERKMESLSTSRQTVLRMAVSQGTTLSLGGVFAHIFRKDNPEILLSMEEALADNVCMMVNYGTVDLGIVGSHPDYMTDFECLPLRLTGTWLLLHESNPLTKKEVLVPKDLTGASFGTPGVHDHLYRFFVEMCRNAHVNPHIIGQASYSFDNGLAHANKEVTYFGFSPEIVTPPEGWCVRPLKAPGSEKFGTYLIKRHDTPITDASAKMLEFIRNRFNIEGTLR